MTTYDSAFLWQNSFDASRLSTIRIKASSQLPKRGENAPVSRNAVISSLEFLDRCLREVIALFADATLGFLDIGVTAGILGAFC